MDIGFMETIRYAPLFKLVICFIIGIIAADYYEWSIAYACLTTLPLFTFCILKEKKLTGWKVEYLIASCIYISTIGTGTVFHLVTHTNSGLNVQYINCRTVELEGIIISKVKQNEWGKKAWMDLKKLNFDNQTLNIQGKVQVYLRTEDSTTFNKHHMVRIWANISNIRSRYPSYLTYLHRNGVFHAAYVDSLEIIDIHKNVNWYFEQAQAYFSAKLSELIPDDKLAGIAQAMFVGDKSGLEEESRDIFARVGASHILAISGLHIGMIYLLLSWFLQHLHLLPQGKRIKNLLILTILLCYMCLTGASPAVIRAVCMYGFILLFKICYQRYHILNVLAVSAFVQLMWDTSIVFNIGFQLSYVAVTGIVILFPLFEKMFPADHIFLQKLYACMGVTICATLSTSPLIMIYFGQFPTYFLLTNLLITVLTGGTVFAGFITVMFIGIPYLNQFCAFVCYLLLYTLNWVCEWVANLPYTLIENLRWDDPAIYILIVQLLIAWGVLTFPQWIRFKLARPIPHPPILQEINRQT